MYDLFDRYDEATGVQYMARTTGYTARGVVRMLAEGLFPQKSVILPEYIGKDEACVNFILRGFREREIIYEETTEAF